MNPLTPRYTVTLEGHALPLRFELFDWAEAERLLKIELLPFGDTQFWREPGLYQNAVLLFVGLRHAMPGLTLERIHETITWENHAAISGVLQEALEAFFRRLREMSGPASADETAGEAPTTGQDSGPSGDTTSA